MKEAIVSMCTYIVSGSVLNMKYTIHISLFDNTVIRLWEIDKRYSRGKVFAIHTFPTIRNNEDMI